MYLYQLISASSDKAVARQLDVSIGTLRRWVQTKRIPKYYEVHVRKLLCLPIDYASYTTKEKDQFFTPVSTAQQCVDIFCDVIRAYGESVTDFRYIEPSAGDGQFLRVLPRDTIAMDIEPRHPSIIRSDYLNWIPTTQERYVVFGNPPFGLRGHAALQFINHSSKFAEYVCFILPPLFESDGKGVPRKRVKGYHLLHSSKMPSTFYEPNGNLVVIQTIFQIWSKHHANDKYKITDSTSEGIRVYSISDGGTGASTRNKRMIGRCHLYLPSTCFGRERMKAYLDFEELPNRRGYGIVFQRDIEQMVDIGLSTHWDKVAFLSTNSAYNLRSSQIHALFNSI